MWKVMIADDEPYIREGIEKLVDWASIDCQLVFSASTGEELLTEIKKCPPDVAIIDIKMPVMDGFAVAEYISTHDLGVEVIFLTAYSDFEFAKRAIKYSVSDYIVKTSALDEIPQAIRRLQTKRELELARSYRLAVLRPIHMVEPLRRFYKHALEGVNYRILDLNEQEEVLLIVENKGTDLEENLERLREIKKFSKTFLGVELSVVCSWPFDHKRESTQVYEQLKRSARAEAGYKEILVLDQQDKNSCMQEAESLLPRVQSFIREHYNERLTLADIAGAVHVSPGYLSRYYKAQVGENLFETINSLRIEKAKGLLAQGSLKIYEVARQTGFEDTAYFSKVFKKYAGCPPKDYGQNYGK